MVVGFCCFTNTRLLLQPNKILLRVRSVGGPSLLILRDLLSPTGPKVYPSLNHGIVEDVEGFMYGSVQLLSQPREVDHPITLGIGGIGRDIVSERVHTVKPCSGRLLVGFAPGIERGHWQVARASPLKYRGGRRSAPLLAHTTLPGRLNRHSSVASIKQRITLCRLRPHVSGPPSLTQWVSEVVTDSPPPDLPVLVGQNGRGQGLPTGYVTGKSRLVEREGASSCRGGCVCCFV